MCLYFPLHFPPLCLWSFSLSLDDSGRQHMRQQSLGGTACGLRLLHATWRQARAPPRKPAGGAAPGPRLQGPAPGAESLRCLCGRPGDATWASHGSELPLLFNNTKFVNPLTLAPLVVRRSAPTPPTTAWSIPPPSVLSCRRSDLSCGPWAECALHCTRPPPQLHLHVMCSPPLTAACLRPALRLFSLERAVGRVPSAAGAA